MSQKFSTNPKNLIEFNFKQFKLPTFVTKFKPLIYKNGEYYYAMLSSQDDVSLAGFGASPEDALIDWNDKVCENLAISGEISATLKRAGKTKRA